MPDPCDAACQRVESIYVALWMSALMLASDITVEVFPEATAADLAAECLATFRPRAKA